MYKRKFASIINKPLGYLGINVVGSGRLNYMASTLSRSRLESERAQRELQKKIDALTTPAYSAAVQQALDLKTVPAPNVQESELNQHIEQELSSLPPSRELFFMNGTPLPCWRDEDVSLYDDWLTNPRNYPVYYAVLKHLTSKQDSTRLLEIGVRTGYLGVVFARANEGTSLYLGVDPNQYVENGLELASKSFALLRTRLPHYDYFLTEGYSWEREIIRSLTYSKPYQLIHIDGDHSLAGKLHDLDIARYLIAEGGTVLVDDYFHHPPVRDAIARACALGWFKQVEVVQSMRGLALLRV